MQLQPAGQLYRHETVLDIGLGEYVLLVCSTTFMGFIFSTQELYSLWQNRMFALAPIA